MTEQQLAAMRQALSVIKNSQDYKMGRASTVEAAEDLRTAIEEAETAPVQGREWKWFDAPVKTQWGDDMVVADLAIDKDHTVSVYCEKDQRAKVEAMFTPPAAPVQEPIELHVLHSHIAGALFDFMGWLTSREKRLTLSSTDEAGPAVEAITEFAKMRGLSLQDAQVEHWQAILTTPPAAQREWQGLTEQERDDLALLCGSHATVCTVEETLKAKNP